MKVNGLQWRRDEGLKIAREEGLAICYASDGGK